MLSRFACQPSLAPHQSHLFTSFSSSHAYRDTNSYTLYWSSLHMVDCPFNFHPTQYECVNFFCVCVGACGCAAFVRGSAFLQDFADCSLLCSQCWHMFIWTHSRMISHGSTALTFGVWRMLHNHFSICLFVFLLRLWCSRGHGDESGRPVNHPLSPIKQLLILE